MSGENRQTAGESKNSSKGASAILKKEREAYSKSKGEK